MATASTTTTPEAAMSLRNLAVVDAELRSLCVEGRKYPDVQQAAERAIARIRAVQDVADPDEQKSVLSSEAILRPFLSACSTKLPALVKVALGSFQKLVSISALTPSTLSLLVSNLRILAEMPGADIQLKILQTLSLLSSPQSFQACDEAIAQMISICFKLHTSADPIICNTAGASLKQLISLVFDRADHADADAERVALELLDDLCNLALGVPPKVYTAGKDFSSNGGLELIESVIMNHYAFMKSKPQFVELLRMRVFPLAKRTADDDESFARTVRLMRIFMAFMLYYYDVLKSEIEILVSILVRSLEPQVMLWKSVLALEVIRVVASKPELLLHYYTTSDGVKGSTPLFGAILNALGRAMHQRMHGSPLDADAGSLLWVYHNQKIRALDQLNEGIAPSYDELAALSLAVDSLMLIAEGLSKLAADESGSQNRLATEAVRAMMQASWFPVLSSFERVLAAARENQQIRFMLNGYQSFLITSGKLTLVQCQTEFLKSLCKFCVPGDRQQLSLKNAMSFKTLFNVIDHLGNSLGTSWLLVLEAIEHLDSALSQAQTKDDNDLSILEKLLSNLFESSKDLNDESVLQLLTALGTLSLSGLANAATAENTDTKPAQLTSQPVHATLVPTIRTFWLENLVKTVKCNIDRVEIIWEFTVGHLQCVMNSRSPSIRAYGVSCFSQLSKLALKNVNADGSSFDKSDLPSMILMPLSHLVNSKFADTRGNLLTFLYELLQSSGLRIGSGWSVVFCVLKDVSSDPSCADFIPLAFKVLQLVVDDFLDALPGTSFALLIDTIGCYGRQRASSNNISFTSIGLLWHVSDHIGRAIGNASCQSINPGGKAKAEHILPETSDSLQLLLFKELQGLCTDSRSEVRNSAVQTLHSTIAAYGDLMSLRTWNLCRGSILFPLLEVMFEQDASKRDRPSEIASASKLGTDAISGEKIMMVMHHSRDTAEKQWDETRVHALQGSSRVFRHFFERFNAFDQRSIEDWQRYMSLIEKCITAESAEVAHSAILSLQEIILSPSTALAMSSDRRLLESALSVYRNIVVTVSSGKESDVMFEIYTVLLESASSLLGDDPARCRLFSADDLLIFLQLADKLLLLSHSSSVSTGGNGVNIRESLLQRAALQLVERLASAPGSEELWPMIIDQICGYVRSVVPKPSPGPSNAFRASFAAKSIPLLASLFCVACPSEVRNRPGMFEKVIGALHHAVTTPNLPEKPDIRTEAVESFMKVIKVLPDVNFGSCKEAEALRIWAALADTFSLFLGVPSSSLPDFYANCEDLQVIMVHVLANDVLPSSLFAPRVIKQRLIEVLTTNHDSGSVIGIKHNSSFVHPSAVTKSGLAQAKTQGLFSLCFIDSKEVDPVRLEIAKLASPLLLARCRRILEAYTNDERRSGERPLPHTRREEVAFILGQLSVLQTSADVIPSATTSGTKIGKSQRKGHLLALLPTLCDSVCIREPQLKSMLSKIFHEISRELDLEKA